MIMSCLIVITILLSLLVVPPSLALLHRIQHEPIVTGSLVILVLGDFGRHGKYNQSEIAFQMGEIAQKYDVDFVITTGDNFYKNGLEEGVDDPAFNSSYMNIYTHRGLQIPWYAVLGNRDYRSNVMTQLSPILREERDWRWNCHRSYVLNTGIVDFLFVDTTPFVNKYYKEKRKDDWEKNSGIETDRETYILNLLEEVKEALGDFKAPWIGVIGHHTMKSRGENGETKEIVQRLLPILEDYNVDFYIHGHDHCMQHDVRVDQRISKIEFVTSGGGSKAWTNKFNTLDKDYEEKFYYDGQGFMLAHVNEAVFHTKFYDVHGEVLYDWDTYRKSED